MKPFDIIILAAVIGWFIYALIGMIRTRRSGGCGCSGGKGGSCSGNCSSCGKCKK